MHHIHRNQQHAHGDDWIDTLTNSHLRAVADGIAAIGDDLDDEDVAADDELDSLLASFTELVDEAAHVEARRHGIPAEYCYGDDIDLYDFDPDNRGVISPYEPADPRLDELHVILACNDPGDLRLTTAALDWLLADFPKPQIVDTYGLDAEVIAAYLYASIPSLDASEWFTGLAETIIARSPLGEDVEW